MEERYEDSHLYTDFYFLLMITLKTVGHSVTLEVVQERKEKGAVSLYGLGADSCASNATHRAGLRLSGGGAGSGWMTKSSCFSPNDLGEGKNKLWSR